MDAIAQLLSAVRLQSSVLSFARLSAPSAVVVGDTSTAVVHAVVRGRCLLRLSGEAGPGVWLDEGDVAFVPSRRGHVVATAAGVLPIPIQALSRLRGPVPVVEHGPVGGALTEIICGVIRLDRHGAESLLAALPPVLVARARESAYASWVRSSIDLLHTELATGADGSATMVARVLDLLFIHALRHHLATSPSTVKGWLGAVRDQHIGRALALIHKSPESRWTASTLGAKVGLSRSSFFERFTDLVGEPPARYLARLRAQAAAELVRRGDLSIAEVAMQVGYSSEDALSRLLKRELGVSPRALRRSSDRL
jgi:AraC-like DNA-binding protein